MALISLIVNLVQGLLELEKEGVSVVSPMAISIVIPSWNTRELLLESLGGIAGDPAFRLCVVDNASSDGSSDAVRTKFPSVECIDNGRNAGFAAAANRGIKWALEREAESPVLLLNADTRCTPQVLHALTAQLEENPRLGAIAPGLRLPDGSPQPYAYGGDPDLGYLWRRGWNRLFHQRGLHDWNVSDPMDVDWVSFACVCMHPDALRQVGGLDDGFFMYFEDNDWCLRARAEGWRIRYDPRVAITHIGGASLRQSPAAAAEYRRSLRRFFAKHYPPWQRIILAMLLPFYARLARRGAFGV